MDLNQLFSNHQVALFNAHQATSVDERQTYGELVEHMRRAFAASAIIAICRATSGRDDQATHHVRRTR